MAGNSRVARQATVQRKGADVSLVRWPATFQRTLILSLVVLLSRGSSFAPEVSASGNFPQKGARISVSVSLPCERPGWFPDGFGLKDHTLFWYGGLYYIASIYLGQDGIEDRFAYAASPDLCQWNDLGGILMQRPFGDWDEYRIWAPYVFEEGGVYYMFYTGVTHAFAQSIMLATSLNPASPSSWERQGVAFQPTHSKSVWGGFDTWSDCRDPTVVKIENSYYMYYTGRDTDGGIVGLATASSLLGPWTDWGAVVTTSVSMPESPTMAVHDKLYYLFYNDAGEAGSGEVYHFGPTPAGPWSEAYAFRPGWAHEVWMGQDGMFYTSYLTDYTITIRRLTWDEFYEPPRPFIGEAVFHVLVPLVLR
jgi:hypothetical protein